jgi:hypothetical protein
VRVWDSRTGRQRAKLLGHTGALHGVALSADGRLLVTGGFDGLVRVWDARSGNCLHTPRSDRRYERLDVTGLIGLTEAQRAALSAGCAQGIRTMTHQSAAFERTETRDAQDNTAHAGLQHAASPRGARKGSSSTPMSPHSSRPAQGSAYPASRIDIVDALDKVRIEVFKGPRRRDRLMTTADNPSVARARSVPSDWHIDG